MEAQRTLKRQISCAGIGLHSGQKVTLTLKPAAADTGVRFRRTDLGVEIPARVNEVSSVQHATVLGKAGATVETVEHLLAALVSAGIDNVVIELNHREVPIMDGSSAPFLYLLQEAGVKTLASARRYLKILKPVQIATGDKRIAIYPRIISRSATRSASITRCCGTSRAPSGSPRRRLRITSRPRAPSASSRKWSGCARTASRSAAPSKTPSSSATPTCSTRCGSMTSS